MKGTRMSHSPPTCHTNKTRRAVVGIALAIAFLFMGLRTLNLSWTAGGKMLPSVLDGLMNSPALVGEVLFFAAGLIALHLAVAAAWLWIWCPLFRAVLDGKRAYEASLLGFLALWLWILLANAMAFPRSANAFWTDPPPLAIFRTLLFVVLSALLALGSVGGLACRFGAASPKRRRIGIGLASLAILGAAAGAWIPMRPSDAEAYPPRPLPDVVLLGVDGVRPDHLGFYNGLQPSLTPTLDALLHECVVFLNAWTPLARTYPSWLSILTGQTPANHGGIFNLIAPDETRRASTLGHRLADKGYHRLYAIDETRFSNLDGSYGFDQMVAPAIGAADFLLGSVSDIPLVNLLAGTPIARWLFPTVYMNRALKRTYRPEIFDRRLAGAIRRFDPAKPLFLAVHFELPHWPYTWANHESFSPPMPPELELVSTNSYHKSIARVDRQSAPCWGN
jgi:hypothetical protein